MPEASYAAKLRARAAEARDGWSRETPPSARKDAIRGRAHIRLNEAAVLLSPDEVEALAEALEKAASAIDRGAEVIEDEWHGTSGYVEKMRPIREARAALARLNVR